MNSSTVAGFMQSLKAGLAKDTKEPAFVDRAGRLSFTQMHKKVTQARKDLRKAGCKKGDRIAALTSSCTEVIALEWATYLIGGIWLGVPSRERRPDVIASIISAAQPSVFFLEPGALSAADRSSLLSLQVFKASDLGSGGERLGFEMYKFRWTKPVPAESFAVNGKSSVRIRFTSGATGEPKGIFYTRETHDAIFKHISDYVLDQLEDRAADGKEVMIHGAPVAWASGSLIAPLFYRGGCNVILPRWDTDEFVRLVRSEQCTLTFLTPTMLRRLVKYSEERGSSWAQSLKNVLVAGAPTPVPTMRRALRLFDATFYTTLGMTEASFPITWHRVRNEDVDRSQNLRPYIPLGVLSPPYEEGGSCLTHRCKGELKVRGGALAAGKWNWRIKPNRRRPKLFGKFHWSGDMLEFDGRQYHYLSRRDDSCIETGIWENPAAAPEAIEAVMQDCEEVEYVCVDRLVWGKGRPGKRRIKADLVVQTPRMLEKGAANRFIKHLSTFFKDHRSKANLANVDIGDVKFGRVVMTSSGKPVRRRNLCANKDVTSSKPGGEAKNRRSLTLHAQAWTGFDFSLLSSGPLYFYVGSGLSIASGLVGWDEMACMVWRYRRYYEDKNMSSDLLASLGADDEAKRAMSNAEFLQTFMDQRGKGRKGILSHVSEDPRTFGRTVLLNLILRRRSPRTRFRATDADVIPDPNQQPEERSRYGQEPEAEDFALQSLVWRANCHGVLTPNYDMFLEHAYSLFNHGSALRSYRFNASFLRYIFSNPRFVLKLHGDINDIGTMLLNPKRLWNNHPPHKARPRDLEMVYSTALKNGHMVYVGAGFRDDTIRMLHADWTRKGAGSKYFRVALLPKSDFDKITKSQEFKDIVFLTYQTELEGKGLRSGAPSHAVREFLSRLVEVRGRVRLGPQSVEATDILKQVFHAHPDDREPKRRFRTEPWATKSTKMYRD